MRSAAGRSSGLIVRKRILVAFDVAYTPQVLQNLQESDLIWNLCWGPSRLLYVTVHCRMHRCLVLYLMIRYSTTSNRTPQIVSTTLRCMQQWSGCGTAACKSLTIDASLAQHTPCSYANSICRWRMKRGMPAGIQLRTIALPPTSTTTNHGNSSCNAAV